MKTKIASFSFLLSIVLFCGFTPQETGQLYFMRSTDNNGMLIAYKVYIDDKVVCHLKNHKYSVHSLSPGEHTVSIQNGGLGSKNISRPMKIIVEAGKSNYMVAINGRSLYMQEVVETSAQILLKELVETKDCLPAAKK